MTEFLKIFKRLRTEKSDSYQNPVYIFTTQRLDIGKEYFAKLFEKTFGSKPTKVNSLNSFHLKKTRKGKKMFFTRVRGKKFFAFTQEKLKEQES